MASSPPIAKPPPPPPLLPQQQQLNGFPSPTSASTAAFFQHPSSLPLPSSSSLQTNFLLNSLLFRHLQSQQPQPVAASTIASTSTNNNINNNNIGGQPQPQAPLLFPMAPATAAATDFFAGQPQQSAAAANGVSSMFATTGCHSALPAEIDSLYNFLSPNVVLLPVACHSSADEQHIQLLGMPQTVIPIAVHPQMLRQFPVRPLLVETGLARTINAGGLPSQLHVVQQQQNSSPKNNSTQNHQQPQQFHLPIAFRQTMFPQQHPTKPIDASSQTDKARSAKDAEEPLDLTIPNSTANFQKQPNQPNGSRKRTVHLCNGGEEPTKRVNSGEGDHSLSIPSAAALGISAVAVSSISPKNIVPKVAAASGIEEVASKKKFPCNLCGDVSFLALETLEGHKKYYCRNRPREAQPEPSNPRAQVPMMAGKKQQQPTTTASCILLPLQCRKCNFLAPDPEQLATHQKQNHPQPFICVICGYKALTLRGLRTHLRLSHAQQNPMATTKTSITVQKSFVAEETELPRQTDARKQNSREDENGEENADANAGAASEVSDLIAIKQLHLVEIKQENLGE